MGTINRGARQTIKWLSLGADLARRPASGIVVLIYHRVGAGTDSQVDLPVDQFVRQLDFLSEKCDVLTLGEALDELGRPVGQPQTRPQVVITFDDGTYDFAEIAVPLLHERTLPATLYLATDCVEQEKPFWGSGPPLTWNALNDALDSGVIELGSHTHTHALLDNLPETELDAELDRSIQLIGERTGRNAVDFAYPKALRPSPQAAIAVAARFRSAALAGTRSNRFGSTDPQRLSRSPVQQSDDDRFFVAKVRGGMAFEDDVRRHLLERARRQAIG